MRSLESPYSGIASYWILPYSGQTFQVHSVLNHDKKEDLGTWELRVLGKLPFACSLIWCSVSEENIHLK